MVSPVIGNSQDILDIHECLSVAIDNLLKKVDGEDFLESRRALAVEMVEYV